jgi:hypothetical protein
MQLSLNAPRFVDNDYLANTVNDEDQGRDGIFVSSTDQRRSTRHRDFDDLAPPHEGKPLFHTYLSL